MNVDRFDSVKLFWMLMQYVYFHVLCSPLSSLSAVGYDATCELCGFDFENRKALASHARAHLRQQGVDWKVIGSPIETLKAWMKSEPGKVAELHKSYMRGDLPFVKKVCPG